ncbi:MAG: Rrf2 family transcriptional regulator [Alphaproteobacteria bacterium]|nr:Rrf2 family transcriptional regulator [Alphaproteobacteria bacterium]MBU0798291.1 Rrf2 family transcriptional regulator [Alphaproteobacteria bacterium]MBU0886404.1 Rrf2 family transcriptional regulator [Alphaproteobacteria bacterium]MBU1813400.1 Rrf2 family transcriptional regulator [Alphaproteobacteria bacterium]MBU2090631.1 Rrf2 family transcriptional regulator [Alphaproteobacteria bacterium]
MLKASRKLLFAIEAVLDIAYNASDTPVQSRDITERQGIPRRYLEPVLQQLVRAEVLTGVRGPRGGYRLGRERRRITLGEICRIVESGGVEQEEEQQDTEGSELGREIVRPLWDDMRATLLERLDAISIEDLCDQARQKGIDSADKAPLDFTI